LSAEIIKTKTHSFRLLFGDFAHWVYPQNLREKNKKNGTDLSVYNNTKINPKQNTFIPKDA